MKNIKEKAAVISIILKMVFTIIAFIAFSFTGSIAILAEAWHSFTDILTTLLVYFSIKFQKDGSALRKKAKSGKSVEIKRFFYGLISESRVSLFIGVILFFISIGIFRKAIIYKVIEIQNALPVGILYIIFSFFSYIVYRFETERWRSPHHRNCHLSDLFLTRMTLSLPCARTRAAAPPGPPPAGQ